MQSLGRVLYFAQVPAALLLLVWVWIGRAFLGAGGWYIFILVFGPLEVVFVLLTVTTALSYAANKRRGYLPPGQIVALLVSWAAMLSFGFCLVDYGDTEESEASILTQVVGESESTLALSTQLAVASTIVWLIAWLGQLVLTVVDLRRAGRPDGSHEWPAVP